MVPGEERARLTVRLFLEVWALEGGWDEVVERLLGRGGGTEEGDRARAVHGEAKAGRVVIVVMRRDILEIHRKADAVRRREKCE